LLGRLENDVLGKSRISGPRRALVRVGEAVELTEHLEAYRARRRETLEALTERLQEGVRGMLRELQEQTPPLDTLAEAVRDSETRS
jgi:hypothetical protein